MSLFPTMYRRIWYDGRMEIKICDREDVSIIADIGRETYEENYRHLNDPDVMEAYLETTFHHKRIRSELTDPNSMTFLILEGKVPTAFMKVNFPPSQTDFNVEHTMEIQRIYVRQACKGRGYGKVLMDQAKQLASNRQCSEIWLSVWQKNPSAIRFYEKMGFYKSGTRHFIMAGEKQLDYVLKHDLQ